MKLKLRIASGGHESVHTLNIEDGRIWNPKRTSRMEAESSFTVPAATPAGDDVTIEVVE